MFTYVALYRMCALFSTPHPLSNYRVCNNFICFRLTPYTMQRFKKKLGGILLYDCVCLCSPPQKKGAVFNKGLFVALIQAMLLEPNIYKLRPPTPTVAWLPCHVASLVTGYTNNISHLNVQKLQQRH